MICSTALFNACFLEKLISLFDLGRHPAITLFGIINPHITLLGIVNPHITLFGIISANKELHKKKLDEVFAFHQRELEELTAKKELTEEQVCTL